MQGWQRLAAGLFGGGAARGHGADVMGRWLDWLPSISTRRG